MKAIYIILFLTISQLCLASYLEEELRDQGIDQTYAESLASEDYLTLLEEAKTDGVSSKIPSAPVLILEAVQHNCEFRIYNYIEQVLNTYTKCIEVASDESWLMSNLYEVKPHGSKLCTQVQNDEHFKNGNFSILAFSTGGMIARYLIEYCDFEMPIRNVVTIGVPLNGVSALPHLKRSSPI